MHCKDTIKDIVLKLFKFFIISTVLISCVPNMSGRNENVDTKDIENSKTIYAAVLFQVTVPQELAKDDKLYLDVLDEVTGLGLNPKRYPMDKKTKDLYTVRIPMIVGSVIKYRYTHGNSPPAIEYTSDREQVRYRLFQVMSPSEVNDQISGWIDQPYQGPSGRIQGSIIDRKNNNSVSNVLVVAGGAHTLSAADGSFLLEGLPVGTHNLVAYSLDGSYQSFQQGAVVAADATTPAEIILDAASCVNVTFVAKPPQDIIPGIPIRMIGNIYSLGNSFADLNGGVNTVSSRTPLMSLTSDGMYFLTLTLPVGLDLRYKYTLGDGFWNAEQKNSGSFFTRQLIVPEKDVIIEDIIETWKTDVNSDVISFFVKAPDDTPVNDTVSIQFSPYSWMEPIPMWPMGNNQWLYVLYGPLNIDAERILYRFCRNDQCGFADDEATHALDGGFNSFDPKKTPQTIECEINKWLWWENLTQIYPVGEHDVYQRDDNFIAGVEMQKGYHPNWQPYITWALQDASNLNINWIIETPTWSYTRNNLPVLELLPGKDPLRFDQEQIRTWISQNNQKYAVFPMVNFINSTRDEWWQNAVRDAGWWQSWFDRYRIFVLNFASLAAQLNADALILGESSVLPALPNGELFDNTPSSVPSSSYNYWIELIKEVRNRYNGKVLWTVDYDGNSISMPEFISDLDMIYVLWSLPVSEYNSMDELSLVDEFSLLLERDIKPIEETYQKPVIIAIDCPSAIGTSVDSNIGITTNDNLPNIDLEMQSRIYNALFTAVNQKNWIDGFVSRGFYQPVALQDASSSIYGKPASEVLRYWYTKFH